MLYESAPEKIARAVNAYGASHGTEQELWGLIMRMRVHALNGSTWTSAETSDHWANELEALIGEHQGISLNPSK